MTVDYDKLASEPRLLMQIDLKPLQGDRFQPTGFADLGPARYTTPRKKNPDGDADDYEEVEMLLVESPQSVANRMELACWDDAEQDLIADLRGLPFIRILDAENKRVSNSLLEAHRINSEYIMDKKKDVKRVLESDNGKPTKLAKDKFRDEFGSEIEYQSDGRVNWQKFRDALLKYDPNSLIHGCFLEEIGGRLRVTRALSGFIEASGVRVAESGGVKNNIVQPDLKGGEGNVPYHRTEFTAEKITAYFNLDLALLRSYGLATAEETKQLDDWNKKDAGKRGDRPWHWSTPSKLLIALALLKTQRFLSTGLRLRTACDFEPDGELAVTRPKNGFTVPNEDRLLKECNTLIGKCKEGKQFAHPSITEVQWKK